MIALDTNVLIYASQNNDTLGRDIVARAMMEKLEPSGAIVPLQVIGEFLNACRKKQILPLAAASRRAEYWMDVYDLPTSHPQDYLVAAATSEKFTLQYFDALILTVAARAGAILLLSEDMHDGLVVDGVRIVNPFNPANDGVIADFISSIT